MKTTENKNRIVLLFESENLVLNQINKNISEINGAIIKLMEKMGISEWSIAFMQDKDGNFRMQTGYNGFFQNVVKVYENRMKNLLIQKREKIEEINRYETILSQRNANVQSNEQVRNYVDLPHDIVQERAYTTLCSNPSTKYDHTIQNTQPNDVYGEEATQGKTL